MIQRLTLLVLFFATPILANDMTLEQLLGIKEVVDVKISPSAKQIAYTLNVPRTPYKHKPGPDWQELYLVDKKGKVLPFMTGRNRIKQVQWSGDGKQLWLLAKKQQDKLYHIYVFNHEGGEARKIVTRQHSVRGFHLSEDPQKLIFWHQSIEDQPNLELLELGFDAQVVEEESLNAHLWMIDFVGDEPTTRLVWESGHVIRAELSASGKQILVHHSPSYLKDDEVMQGQLSILDIDSDRKVNIAHQGKLGVARFSPNGKHVAFLGSNDPNSPDHGVLMTSDTSAGQSTELLSDFQGFVTDFTWFNNSQIVFTADVGTKSIIGRKSVGSPGPRYKKITDNGLVFTQINAAIGKKTAAVIAHSRRHPREIYWLFDNEVFSSTDHNTFLKSIKLAKQKTITFSADDGLELEGILVSPPSAKDNQPLPLLIVAHGGPESHVSNGWVSSYSQPAQLLAQLGFRTFFPNYRGSSGRGQAFLKLGQNDYAGKEFDDIIAAKRHLVEEGLVDPNQVAITGVSYGGYAAAWGATKQSAEFKAAIMLAGISNNISKFGTTDIATEMVNTHALTYPWQDWQFLLASSPIFHSENHKTPLLIAHGLEDRRVHHSQSMELYRHLKTRDQAPVRLVLYPRQGHGNHHVSSQMDYAKRLLRWLNHFVLENKTTLPPRELEHPELNEKGT